MKQKLLSFMLIVLAVLTCAVFTPQALAEKPHTKASKTTSNKHPNQPAQLQINRHTGCARRHHHD